MQPLDFCRGVLLGGLMGDCYGYVFEDKPTVPFEVPVKLLKDTINSVDCSQLIYTDDTQMGLGILRSVRKNNGLDPEHLAKEFATDYFTDGSHRYYGGTIGSIFTAMKAANYKTPYVYAAQLFGGSGSFGNGGAMRAAPASLYALSMATLEFDNFIVDVTRLTHTNPLAVCGALLQAFAVRYLYSVVHKSGNTLDPGVFIDHLLNELAESKCAYVDFSHPHWQSALKAYQDKFELVKNFLAVPDPPISYLVSHLGNDLKAINSVPTAIYAFLRSIKPINGIPFDSIPLRCLVYAICLGGDTDTIGSMACSLAGGYVGLSPYTHDVIPDKVLARCERLDVLEDYATWCSSLLK